MANTSRKFKPLTPETWNDFETLLGVRGACGGCWCMAWRLTRSDFERQKGDANKSAMRSLVESGESPGVLAYADSVPVGWCAVAPREAYPALQRSRVLKSGDDRPVWSISCLFIKKDFRNRGLSVELLKAAIEFVRERGGLTVEGYPVEPKGAKTPDVFAWTGLASAFRRAGFSEHLRRSETRPIMRFEIDFRTPNPEP